MLNNEVLKYIEEKFEDKNLDNNQKAALLEEYLNSNKPLEEIKKSIDAKYDELVNNNVSSADILNSINNDVKIIGKKDNEVQVAIDLKDIDDIRSANKYYDHDTDSMTYAKDGNDYGLVITNDYKTNINFSPVLKSKDKTYLYEWNKNTNTFIIKSTNEEELSPNTNFTVVKERHITDMSSVGKEEMLKNSLIRYSYISKSKYGKNINSNKIGEAISRLKDKSSDEVNKILSNSLHKNRGRVKQLGYAKTLSLGLIFIILGCIICIIASLA